MFITFFFNETMGKKKIRDNMDHEQFERRKKKKKKKR